MHEYFNKKFFLLKIPFRCFNGCGLIQRILKKKNLDKDFRFMKKNKNNRWRKTSFFKFIRRWFKFGHCISSSQLKYLSNFQKCDLMMRKNIEVVKRVKLYTQIHAHKFPFIFSNWNFLGFFFWQEYNFSVCRPQATKRSLRKMLTGSLQLILIEISYSVTHSHHIRECVWGRELYAHSTWILYRLRQVHRKKL